MTAGPKQHLILISFSTLLAAFSLASIINFTDPESGSLPTFAFFYFSLFLMLLGIFTLIGLGLRQKFISGHYVANLGNSFRQAIFLALMIVACLILMSKGLLFWWVALTLILFLASIEAFLNLKI